ncbi:DUF86 domain-containing protein [Sporolactobacillus sp. THM7-4]|nr:DUF86 domain-containing protein [Sporolactobacillus sp. THM7-4]
MYFVDRKELAKKLDYMNELLHIFHDQKNWENKVEALALERLAQNLIESMIDVGNQMIDGFIMRDPGGYDDVIDILADESVLPSGDAQEIKEVIHLRKTLVQDYTEVDHGTLRKTIADHFGPLQKFSSRIESYLEQEMGPVSAFSPDTDKKR